MIIKPHFNLSNEVEDKDLEVVLKAKDIMFNLCHSKTGIYGGGLAVVHSQIEEKNPLRFFVTATNELFINPKIIRHTNNMVDSKEGCLSYADRPEIIVQRWHKCEIEYQTIEDNKLSEVRALNLSGKNSFVLQHEIDHMNGKYIFNNQSEI